MEAPANFTVTAKRIIGMLDGGQSGNPKGAFVDAFEGGGGLVMRGKWTVTRDTESATARYEGRGGVIGVATMMSGRAQAEENSAVGSEINFRIDEVRDGLSICSMWLALSGARSTTLPHSR